MFRTPATTYFYLPIVATLTLMFSILSPISIPKATAASPLVTCIKFQSGTERISKSGKCRIGQEAQANWRQLPSDSPLSTEPKTKLITICSNQPSSTVRYQIIRAKCARHQVSTIYSRSSVLATAPIIEKAVSRGYNSAALILAKDPGVNPDAPIAFYTITTNKGDTQDIFYWRDLEPVINKLNPLTTYTFIITATTADGTSSSSSASTSVTTPEYVPPSINSITVTCANGGTCVVGDRGPGGGIVYYVSASYFTSAGSTCNTRCKYLEVAPASWQSAGASVAEDSNYGWSTNESLASGQDTTTVTTEGYSTSERLNWKIGQGLYNTSVMKVLGATSAAQAAVLAYAGNSAAGQWFIPSMNELNELCKYARGQITGDPKVACDDSGTLKIETVNDLGGFRDGMEYWSSSERTNSRVWNQFFGDGDELNERKISSFPVRPVRAF